MIQRDTRRHQNINSIGWAGVQIATCAFTQTEQRANP